MFECCLLAVRCRPMVIGILDSRAVSLQHNTDLSLHDVAQKSALLEDMKSYV